VPFAGTGERSPPLKLAQRSGRRAGIGNVCPKFTNDIGLIGGRDGEADRLKKGIIRTNQLSLWGGNGKAGRVQCSDKGAVGADSVVANLVTIRALNDARNVIHEYGINNPGGNPMSESGGQYRQKEQLKFTSCMCRASRDSAAGANSLGRKVQLSEQSPGPSIAVHRKSKDGRRICMLQSQGPQLRPRNMFEALGEVDIDIDGEGGGGVDGR
jgi:hypothetical protein